MDKILLIGTIISELMAIIICLHAFFGEKIVFDKFLCPLVLIEWAIMYLVSVKALPRICMVIVYGLMWFFCFKRFKKSIGTTTLKFLFGIAVCGLVETAMLFFHSWLQEFFDYRVLTMVDSWCVLAIVCYIGGKISKKVKVIQYRNDIRMRLIILFYLTLQILLLVDYIFFNMPMNLSKLIGATCIFLGYFYVLWITQTKFELERKNLEMNLNKVYGEAYVELVSNIRKRQHDFKNQLGAIYSMHITATTFDELVDMQRQYGDELLKECRYDSILTNCTNPVLAGYLYQRCLSCESIGIKVDYDIRIMKAECICPLHEIIEMVGILIDNACESFLGTDCVQLGIKLNFKENEENIILAVSNPSRVLKYSEIENMFKMGISSKGKNRGIGLARLKEIVNQCGSEVEVMNYQENDENWIMFQVRIGKSR